MSNMLTGKAIDVPEPDDPDDPDDPDEPIGILVHSKQHETFKKLVGKHITTTKPARANEAEFQILAKDRDEVQALLDAHQGE